MKISRRCVLGALAVLPAPMVFSGEALGGRIRLLRAPPTATTVVHNTTELNAALASAATNAVIACTAAGNPYSAAAINSQTYPNVTIQSDDNANPAVFTILAVSGVNNLTFKNIRFDFTGYTHAELTFAIRFDSCNHLNFINLDIHGTTGGDPNANPYALDFNFCTFINISHCTIHDTAAGVTHNQCENVTAFSNFIYNIGSDGIIGGGTSTMTVDTNRIQGIYGEGGGHPDSIQFYTTLIPYGVNDIAVTNNLTWRENGLPSQGVFLGNENSQVYTNVTLTNNWVVGAYINGVAVTDADNVVITGNHVIPYTDQDSRLLAAASGGPGGDPNAQMTGNFGTAFTVNGANVAADNTIISPVSDGGVAAVASWVALHPEFSAGIGA